MEDEEDIWFDQDDDFDDADLSTKVDLFKTKLEVDYEPINKLLGNNKQTGKRLNLCEIICVLDTFTCTVESAGTSVTSLCFVSKNSLHHVMWCVCVQCIQCVAEALV